ncbi:MAG: hypothetical protein Q8N63_01420 [Nanoarchaeota archaeon]|nr:hypothetical protein [Nanoarchaeota archaeon]
MRKIKTVSIFDSLGENVFTRTTMQDFVSYISKIKDKELILDFKKVKFISRSCADEYIKFEKRSNKKIESINMSEEVKMVMNAVKTSLNSIFVHRIKESNSSIVCT